MAYLRIFARDFAMAYGTALIAGVVFVVGADLASPGSLIPAASFAGPAFGGLASLFVFWRAWK